MDERYESKIIELTTLTPLFIKGKDLDYGEGMLCGSDGMVYLINNDKLCDYIYNHTYDKEEKLIKIDYVNSYISFFDRDPSSDIVTLYNKFARTLNLIEVEKKENVPDGFHKMSLQYFLESSQLLPNDTELRQNIIENELASGITNISRGKRFIQSRNAKNFIPGSSIKGAIRNAIIWKIISLKNTQTPQEEVLDQYKKSLKGIALATEALRMAGSQQWSDAQQKFQEALQIDFLEKEKFSKCKDGNRINFFQNKSDPTKKTLDKTLNQFTQTWDKSLTTKTVIRPISEIRKHKTCWQSTPDILRDILRIVKISDANLTGKVTLENKYLHVVCKDNNTVYQKYNYQKKQYQPIKLDLEILPESSKATFKVTIDKEMAKMFFGDSIKTEYLFLYSVSELLNVVNEFFLSVWEAEKQFFSYGSLAVSSIGTETDERKTIDVRRIHSLYNKQPFVNNETILRTGWGGGYMSKTQFLHIDDVSRTSIRNLRHDRGDQVAPKSRLLIVEGKNAISPLGWCKLRILGDAKDILLTSIDAANIRTDFLTEQPRQNRQSNNHGNRRNSEKPITEKEIQQSKAKANALFKKAVAQIPPTTQLTYTIGKKVSATVKELDFFKKIITVKIGNQIIEITTNQCKQEGETVTIEITKVENGQIKEAKILKGKL